ncbi:MAG: transposase [Actinobacteria bacterium]|nr:transposase [Actinomycetota bacterium]
MPKTRRYPPEIRERAVRLVFEHGHGYPSQWKAICSIAEKSDLNRETLRQWVRQAERDSGRRPGLTTDERQRLHDLEREVKELRRANEILKAASAFFGAELDRRHR